MYKCTECGLEFENKPDYCDCGNDEFVLTDVKEEIEPVPVQKAVVQEPAKQSHTVEAGTYAFSSASQKADTNNNNFSPLAVLFFIICLLLSIYVGFIWNPIKDKSVETKQEETNTVVKKIPSINELWKDGAIVNKQAQTVANNVKTVTKTEAPKVQPAVKQTPVQSKPATVKQTAKKSTPIQTKKTSTTTQKPTTQTKQVSKPQTTVKQPVVDTAAQKAAEEAKKQQEAKLKAEQEAKLAAEKAKKAMEQKQEYSRYKINLRNTIGQKIDFTRVIGDGDCAVTFKVDSSGRLVNRAFAKQSSNITLNNVVYNAVMSVPSFNPPPSLYNNETLRLTIKFNNGNFAITLE